MHLLRANTAPDYPTSFHEASGLQFVWREPEEVVVKALRRFVLWDTHVHVLQVLQAIAPIRVPRRLKRVLEQITKRFLE